MDRDVILISRAIERSLHYDLTEAIEENKKHKACTLILTTYGGDADAGFRIGRCLQHHYDHVRLVIPSLCKSAGTLIAIAANELAIGDLGELGPLDVQVRKHNEIMERSSGLDFMEAMDTSLTHVMRSFRKALVDIKHGTRISTKLAGEFAAQIASSISSPLYAQIDPNRIGEMQRAINIALGYGGRLARKAKSIEADGLQKLVADYPSHGFVIDRSEAKELFTNVVPLTDQEQRLVRELWPLVNEESETGPTFIDVAAILKDDKNEPETVTTQAPSSGPECAGVAQDGGVGSGAEIPAGRGLVPDAD